MQEGIITMKITNIYFKNHQEYKLSLELTVPEIYNLQFVDQYYFKFGLIRIGECSNYGKNIQKQYCLFRFKINENGYGFLAT